MQRHTTELLVLSSGTDQDKGLSRFGSRWKGTCNLQGETGRNENSPSFSRTDALVWPGQRMRQAWTSGKRLKGGWITLCSQPEFSRGPHGPGDVISDAEFGFQLCSYWRKPLMAMSLKTRTPSAWEVLLVLLWESVICSTLILVNSIFISHYPYAVFSSGNWNKVGNGRDKHFSLSMAYILVIQMDN